MAILYTIATSLAIAVVILVVQVRTLKDELKKANKEVKLQKIELEMFNPTNKNETTINRNHNGINPNVMR